MTIVHSLKTSAIELFAKSPSLTGFLLGLGAGLAFLLGAPVVTALVFSISLLFLRSRSVLGLALFGAGYMCGSSTWFFPGTSSAAELALAVLGTAAIGLVFHGIPNAVLRWRYGWAIWPLLITAAEQGASLLGMVGVPLGLVGLHTPFGLLTSLGSLMITSVAIGYLIVLPIALQRYFVFAPIIIVAIYFIGLPTEPREMPLKVGAVSHNPPSGAKWHPDTAPTVLANLLERSRLLEDADLIVWPENAVTTTFNIGEALEQVQEIDVPLLFGMTRYKTEDDFRFVNSAILRLGDEHQLSDKQRLVPVIEAGLEPIKSASILPGERRVFELPNGQRFLVLLCYEVSFSIPPADLENVDFVIVISAETGMFTRMTDQVYGNMVIARSLETGLPMQRVSDASY